MRYQITIWLHVFALIVFSTVLVFICSCSKELEGPKPDNPATGGQTSGGSTGRPGIVYTDLIPDSNILKLRNDTFKLDINNDGIYDFEFHKYITTVCIDNWNGGGSSVIRISVQPIGGSNAIMTGLSNLPPALNNSVAITPDSTWAPASQDLLTGPINVHGRCTAPNIPLRGNWINVSDKFLGLKVIKGTNIYYGWVRLTSSYQIVRHTLNNGQLIVKDYAYNNVTNKPILAGQTK
jgi:hypothetical protein